MNYEEAIQQTYGYPDLITKILAELQRVGIDSATLTRESLSQFEDIHIRGRGATIELAQKVGLDVGMRVLDVGCGIGGPARTLAAEFGCNVTGLDLNHEYCRTAEILTNLVGLSNKVTIKEGNALDMPFKDSAFDIVWIQHTLVNIRDKKRIFNQVRRVLHPRGLLALYEICVGFTKPIHFPVVWANNPSLSFLISPEELHQLILKSGFKELFWNDVTKKTIESIRTSKAKLASKTSRSIGYGVIIPDIAKKGANIIRNLEEGRIVVIQGLFERKE